MMLSQTLNYTPRQKLYFALLVNIMIPLGAMSTDIYLPSLPAIGHYFNADNAWVQLTITAYVIAMGLTQLIAGPLSDAYGRKSLLLMAVFMQIVAVIGILISSSISQMIIFRFVQGMGAAFMMVPARAILNDVFDGHELKKQFNYCTISFAIGPIVAPFFGGYLQNYFGWQSNFIFILMYAVLLLALLSAGYQETIANPRRFSPHDLWNNYRIILGNRFFLCSAIFAGMAWGYGCFFNINGPFLIQDGFHYSSIAYGRIALLMGLAWFLGNTLNRILFRYDEKAKTQLALWLALLTSMIMLIFVSAGFFNMTTFIIPTFIVMLLGGFIFPIYIGECMVIFSDLAASANACLFSLIWIIFSGITFIAILLNAHSLLPITLAFLGVSVISLLFYFATGLNK